MTRWHRLGAGMRCLRDGRRPERDARRPEIPGLMAVNEATVYPHVFGNADREVGGVLVGRIERGAAPVVTGAIPALSADERRATLTFTQDAWEHIHRTLDCDFSAAERIVGWYHSHPGFGIFLSEHDLFIHRNFFSGRSQIALVVDPIGMTEGVFAWRDRDIACFLERPTPRGWVAADHADSPQPHQRLWTVESRAPARNQRLALIVAGAVGLSIGFGLWDVVVKPSPALNTDVVVPGVKAPSRDAPAPAATRHHKPGHVTTTRTSSYGG